MFHALCRAQAIAVKAAVWCCVGGTMGPRASADDLFRDADVAMYRAKVGGKSGNGVFTPDPDGEAKGGAGVRSGA
jgi:predicted signal transduction protein with EAL and GGDEF domain